MDGLPLNLLFEAQGWVYRFLRLRHGSTMVDLTILSRGNRFVQ